ncbi:MAG: hypothetical protein M9894_40095 [Planctomycetes bacterium]|nr:hypothetical protein [Planctomycetota bacterium]
MRAVHLALATLLLAPPALAADRADLARAYRRFEAGYRQVEPADPGPWNRRFDLATISFFAGDAAGAVRALDEATADLLGLDAAWRRAAAVRLTVAPELVVAGQATALRVTPSAPAPARLLLRAPDGRVVWTGDLAPGAPLDVALPRDLHPGLHALEVVAGDGPAIEQRPLVVVARPPQAAAHAVLARLDALPPGPAADVCRGRAARLLRADVVRAASMHLVDLPARMAEVEAEVEALAGGEDPYRGRAGHLWQVVRAGGRDVPLRTYAPPGAAGPRPLVVALHGMGGEEGMFPEAYGGGAIVRLADAHGFLVASPSTDALLATGPAGFDAVVAAVARDHAVDRARVYAIGHSMGGGAAADLARSRADVLAAVACFSGGRFGPGAPLLAVAAERDLVAPGALLADRARRAAARGAPITVLESPGTGHTLTVGARLPEVVRWLLQRWAT